MNDSQPSENRRLREWMPYVVAIVIGLANATKPVHIDDTLYVAIAHRIVGYPLDPYGGMLNWQQHAEPTYRHSISPPLFSYYLAGVLILAGESPFALHLSMIPWLLLAAWGLRRLGQRWSGDGVAVALLALCTPAVVVGVNLMLDIPLLALSVASLEFLARGLDDRRQWGAFLVAGLLAGLATLVKYPALTLAPIALLAAFQARRPGALVTAAGPLIALAAWQGLSRYLYGNSQVSEGMGFLGFSLWGLPWYLGERCVVLLSTIGMTFPIWIISIATGRTRIWSAAFASLFAALAGGLLAYGSSLNSVSGVVQLVSCYLGAFGVIEVARTAFRYGGCFPPFAWREGMGLRVGVEPVRRASLALARGAAPPHPVHDPRLLLVTWIVVGGGFIIAFSPFVAVRSALTILPAIALLLVGSFPSRPRSDEVLKYFLACLATLSALLAWADYRWASVYPNAVETIKTKYAAPGQTVYFVGHWGWQYYAEKAGMIPWDQRWSAPPSGALVAIPLQVDKQFMYQGAFEALGEVGAMETPAHPLAFTTYHRSSRASFYNGALAQTPWGFTTEPTEVIYLLQSGNGKASNAPALWND